MMGGKRREKLCRINKTMLFTNILGRKITKTTERERERSILVSLTKIPHKILAN